MWKSSAQIFELVLVMCGLIITRDTFNSGQKYRNRKFPVILDRDVGLFYLVHRQQRRVADRHRRFETRCKMRKCEKWQCI